MEKADRLVNIKGRGQTDSSISGRGQECRGGVWVAVSEQLLEW